MQYFAVVVLLTQWWSSPLNLGISGIDDINPQACRQWLGFAPTTCLVWQAYLNNNWDIFSRFSNLTSWGDTVRITTSPAADTNPCVAFDFSQTYWCVWQNNNSGNWDIFVSSFDSTNAWQTPYQLTNDPVDEEFPSVCVTSGIGHTDTVWVAWQKMTNGAINIFSCFYNGASWSAPIPVTTDSVSNNIRPKISRRHFLPFVVWEKDADIYCSEFSGGSWQAPQPVTTDPANDHLPEIAADRGYPYELDGAWVTWQSDRDGNEEIYSTGYDSLNVIHRLTSDDSRDINSSPLFFMAVINRQGGPPATAFATNRNGSYDIYTVMQEFYGDTSIWVDLNPAEDVLPVMTAGYPCVWVLWQTDRNGDWDICGSWIWIGGVEENSGSKAPSPAMLNVYPNPFTQRLDIRCSMLDKRSKEHSAKSKAILKIYDVKGRVIRSFNLASRIQDQESKVAWDGRDASGKLLPAGVYFCQLKVGDLMMGEKVVKLEW